MDTPSTWQSSPVPEAPDPPRAMHAWSYPKAPLWARQAYKDDERSSLPRGRPLTLLERVRMPPQQPLSRPRRQPQRLKVLWSTLVTTFSLCLAFTTEINFDLADSLFLRPHASNALKRVSFWVLTQQRYPRNLFPLCRFFIIIKKNFLVPRSFGLFQCCSALYKVVVLYIFIICICYSAYFAMLELISLSFYYRKPYMTKVTQVDCTLCFDMCQRLWKKNCEHFTPRYIIHMSVCFVPQEPSSILPSSEPAVNPGTFWIMYPCQPKVYQCDSNNNQVLSLGAPNSVHVVNIYQLPHPKKLYLDVFLGF